MLTQNQIDQIADKFSERMEKIVQRYLTAIGEHIRDIGTLLPSDVHRLVEMRRVDVNMDVIRREIATALEASEQDVERVFAEVAQTDYRAEAALFDDAKPLPIVQNAALMRMLESYTRQTAGALANLSNTTVMDTAYRAAVDRAIQAAQSGVTDYASAIRQAVKEAASTGLVVKYASGVVRRLDSAVRMNVLDGIRQLNKEVAVETGKEYGADGVDFSAEASRKLADIQKRDDANELGLCMVKTHLSLSDDPGVKGAPKGWKLRIRDVLTFGGAGFVVPVSGSITLMPGTGSNPSFRRVDVDVDTGRVKGIF